MTTQLEITLPPFPRGFHLITRHVLDNLPELPQQGILHIFIQHTSAGICINENADPTVRLDFETVFDKLIPDGTKAYVHSYEGPDDMPAHIKSSIVGQSVSIPITNGRLNLGTWQGVYLGEFRNHGGRRRLILTALS
ncbi:MAG: YjbQ family protein [Chlorobi bacterium]|nr:YjbQ family protein [Chlorobiota bacterium]